MNYKMQSVLLVEIPKSNNKNQEVDEVMINIITPQGLNPNTFNHKYLTTSETVNKKNPLYSANKCATSDNMHYVNFIFFILGIGKFDTLIYNTVCKPISLKG